VSGKYDSQKQRDEMEYREFCLSLPDWVEGALSKNGRTFEHVEERMRLVIELAQLNIEHETGGPFGAGIFEQESGKLLAVGVNTVTGSNCSIAHAEISAIGIAQRITGKYDLGGQGMPAYELVTSCEPCVMCLGGVLWSGVQRLVCGARGEDAYSIGFDEGPKPADWVKSLEDRGIEVLRDVLREQAKSVLIKYRDSGGPIYNARQAKKA